MAKNTVKKSAPVAAERRTIDAKLKAMEGHFGEINGGRKYEAGTKCEILSVYVNRFGQDQARIMIGDEMGYINPKFLKPGKALPAARTAELEAEREEQAKPTMVLGRVVKVSNENEETGKGGSVLLDYSGWFKPIWFGKDQIELLHKFSEKEHDGKYDGLVMAEVPAWKIKSGAGSDSLAAIEAKQAAWAKLVK